MTISLEMGHQYESIRENIAYLSEGEQETELLLTQFICMEHEGKFKIGTRC
jgi:hypothetical protein